MSTPLSTDYLTQLAEMPSGTGYDAVTVKTMAQELLAHRKKDEAIAKSQRQGFDKTALDELAAKGYAIDAQLDCRQEGRAIVQVANMLAELEEWRSGKRERGDQARAWLAVYEEIRRHNAGAFTGRDTGVDCAVKEIARLYAAVSRQEDELAEWRSGARTRTLTIDQARYESQMNHLYEVMTGLGWKPPQS